MFLGRSLPATDSSPQEFLDPKDWAHVYGLSAHRMGYGSLRRVTFQASAIAASLYQTGHQWLDVGCGTGVLVAEWHQHDRNLFGIDHDHCMLAYAQNRMPGRPGGKFVRASAYRLPYPDHTIDGIIATLLTGCLTEPKRFITESQRVLRPGGRAILTFTSANALSLRILSALQRFHLLSADDPNTRGPFRRYNRNDVVQLMENGGFAVERFFFLNCLPLLPVRWMPSALCERLCRHFIVTASRR